MRSFSSLCEDDRHHPGRIGWVGLVVALAWGIGATGCTAMDRTPRGAMQLFVRAVESGDTDSLLELIDIASRKKLVELAKFARELTGGRQKIRPKDLIVAGLVHPVFRIADIVVIKQEERWAQVKLVEPERKAYETLNLVRQQERWRVVLPKWMFHPAKTTTGPTPLPPSPTNTSGGSRIQGRSQIDCTRGGLARR